MSSSNFRPVGQLFVFAVIAIAIIPWRTVSATPLCPSGLCVAETCPPLYTPVGTETSLSSEQETQMHYLKLELGVFEGYLTYTTDVDHSLDEDIDIDDTLFSAFGNITVLLEQKETVKKLIDGSEDPPEELLYLHTILSSVIDQSCAWLQSLGNFTCSIEELTLLRLRMISYKAVQDLQGSLQQLCIECNEQINYAAWAKCSIVCDSNINEQAKEELVCSNTLTRIGPACNLARQLLMDDMSR